MPMATPDELCFMPATEMRSRFQTRDLSPVEVADAVFARIDAIDGPLNAFVTVTRDQGMAQARAAERAYASADPKPPLLGIPISIKDLTVTKGVRTTRGSLLYKNWIPDVDAPFVERVAAAGAVMIGKTNTPEFGWKGETTNRVSGSTHNPWRHGCSPGGSSGGGAAAVAAGLGPLAQGSDGAGSIRIPCGFCGVFGLKPSFGLVPQYPTSAVADLSNVGPMTRTVRDAALLMNATAGADERDRISWSSGVDYLAALDDLDLTGLRIAWSPDLGYAAVEPEVLAVVQRAAERFADLGAVIEKAHPRLDDPWRFVDTIWATAMAAINRDDLDEVRDQIDQGRLAVVESGRGRSGLDLAAAFIARNDYYHGWREFMSRYDLVLTPTLPCTAFPVGLDQPGSVAGRATTYLSWTAFTYPFNATGQPAATVPCGFDASGLPIGLQIVGRWRADSTVLRAAAAYEAMVPWAAARPPV